MTQTENLAAHSIKFRVGERARTKKAGLPGENHNRDASSGHDEAGEEAEGCGSRWFAMSNGRMHFRLLDFEAQGNGRGD